MISAGRGEIPLFVCVSVMLCVRVRVREREKHNNAYFSNNTKQAQKHTETQKNTKNDRKAKSVHVCDFWQSHLWVRYWWWLWGCLTIDNGADHCKSQKHRNDEQMRQTR